jgi:isocitrate/isopropylmalate dehydrogenase
MLFGCSYKWDTLPATQRPERGLLAIRSGLNAFANLRPAIVPRQVRGLAGPDPISCHTNKKDLACMHA